MPARGRLDSAPDPPPDLADVHPRCTYDKIDEAYAESGPIQPESGMNRSFSHAGVPNVRLTLGGVLDSSHVHAPGKSCEPDRNTVAVRGPRT